MVLYCADEKLFSDPESDHGSRRTHTYSVHSHDYSVHLGNFVIKIKCMVGFIKLFGHRKRDASVDVSGVSSSIHSHEGLTFETSAFEILFDDQIVLLTLDKTKRCVSTTDRRSTTVSLEINPLTQDQT